jgi:hypothetical protein
MGLGPGAKVVWGGSNKASKKLAQVTREYWQDWLSQGPALQRQLMNMTTYQNPNLVAEEVGAGVGRVNTALDVASVNYQNDLRGYGVTPSAEQQAVNGRLEALNRTTRVADAANRIRQNLFDRNRAIATGGVATGNVNSVMKR